MRKREIIELEEKSWRDLGGLTPLNIMEVLLDIRDLLTDLRHVSGYKGE